MSFALAIVLILALFIVYYVIVSIYIILFRVTGLTYEKARFQVISMLTNAGYTTTESEVVVGHPARRKLAIATMLTGYAFSVLFVSLVLNAVATFSDVLNNLVKNELIFMLSGLGAFIVILVLVRLPFIKRPFERLIERIGYHFFSREKTANKLVVVDHYGESSVFEIMVNWVPECLREKPVGQANLISLYSIKLLFIKRNGRSINVDKDTIIQKGDTVVLFGDSKAVHDLFALKVTASYARDESRKIKNRIEIITNYESGALCDITIRVMPEGLVDKTLFDAGIRNLGINVIMVSRDGKAIEVTKDTVLQEGDEIAVYGPFGAVKGLFGECYREVGATLPVAHD